MNAPPAKLNPNWTMPPKPQEKCNCGAEIIAEAYIKSNDEGQGWWLVWSCGAEDARCTDEYGTINWPFIEDVASETELEALGFEVTEEWFT